jgi:hypothetical protein
VVVSRYDEKIGLNVNLEPYGPTTDNVVGTQNASANSDLPKPAVDDLSNQSSDVKSEASVPIVSDTL